MALQISHEAPTGVTHASAYHRITRMNNNRYTSKMRITVSIYANAQARTDAKKRVNRKNYLIETTEYTTYFGNTALDVLNQNTVERCYEYLKAQAEYTGATDV
jgi:hypothetical protein